mmetsp:Transcript_19112/g.38510  ORF Transcript_19112/g.38510 Transcript_19112/m.38510 type:complete len:374 (+) Transcript_19112:236-1357(+)
MAVDDNDGLAGVGNAIALEAFHAFVDGTLSILERVEEHRSGTLEDAEGLTRGARRGGKNDDGHLGTELGNLPGGRTGLGNDDDGLGVDVDGGLDGRGGNAFRRRQVTVAAQGRVANGLVEGIIVDRPLGLAARAGHDGNGSLGMLAVGGLAGKHDAVGTVQDGVGNVGALGTGGTGILDHTLEHLSGRDDGLTGNVGLTDHVLLCQKHLLGWDFHTQITTGHHDSIGGGKNLHIVLQSLQVFDFAYNLDVLSAILGKEAADLAHIACLTNKGGGDEVDIILDAKVNNVIYVLLCQGGEINYDAGQVHVLPFTDLGIILNPSNDLTACLVAFQYGKDERSIGNEDALSRSDGCGKIGIGTGQFVSVSLVCVVGG